MKSLNRIGLLSALLATSLASVTAAQQASRPYDQSFLSNAELLVPRQGPHAQPGDLIYAAPGALERLAKVDAVMVDQPVIGFSPDSPVKGLKPEDEIALAETMRAALSGRLAEGGWPVTQKPGPNVLYLRTALTDLVVKKKKRKVLEYTPLGAVVKGARDMLRETFTKVDFIEMTFQAELIDSNSLDVLAAIVAPRGTRSAPGEKETRIDLEQLDQNMRRWGLRLRCQLENSRRAEADRFDCTDDEANVARYAPH